MSRADQWGAATERFVFEQAPAKPARILEIGCGSEGTLSLALSAAGYEVAAVDPHAPEGPIFRQTTFEEYEAQGSFDAVIACLSLHHVQDLNVVLDKVTDLLSPRARLVVVEWGWELFDEPTAAWCLARLPPDGDHEHAWLSRRHADWQQDPEGQRSFDAYMHRWAMNEDLHTAEEMLGALTTRFEESTLEWGPYYYSALHDTSEADEQAAIDDGRIRAGSFRFVGRKRE